MSFTANIEEVVTENLNGLLSKHTTWCRVPLGQVAEVLNGFPFDSKRFVQVRAAPLIRIRDIVRGRTETFYDGEIPDGYWVEAGEILIGMDGDFNIARWKSERALLNQRVLKLSAKSSFYNERFLFFVVAGYLQAINEKTPSVTVKHLSSKTVLSIPLPLPPLAEQTRIAAKLDELLAQVDTLKARIDGIPALLKRFRQSVLAAAVSGRLTEEWRAQNVGWVDEGSPTTAPASSSLPVGWSSKTAGDICGFITKGTTPSKEKMTAGHGEVPYIKVYNLTFTGALDFSIDPTFVDSSTHSTDLKRSIVKPGDVLMNIVGPPLGKVSIVPATYPEWNINQAIARFRAGDEISAAYLALCLRTEEVLSHAVSRAKATAGQFNLTLEICRELPLPVPPEEEQTEIVRRVEQLFAFADQLENKVASAKSRIDHLTQSILAKAFRGELVPQDPNDEPASVLLERIKAQRAAAPKAKRGRKASA